MKASATNCPAEFTLAMIGGRWKIPIIFHLVGGPNGFRISAQPDRCTQKMLTQQLREMERNGLVTRQVYPQVPPKVEYSLTVLGASLGRWSKRCVVG